jgi:hypothetical protein
MVLASMPRSTATNCSKSCWAAASTSSGGGAEGGGARVSASPPMSCVADTSSSARSSWVLCSSTRPGSTGSQGQRQRHRAGAHAGPHVHTRTVVEATVAVSVRHDGAGRIRAARPPRRVALGRSAHVVVLVAVALVFIVTRGHCSRMGQSPVGLCLPLCLPSLPSLSSHRRRLGRRRVPPPLVPPRPLLFVRIRLHRDQNHSAPRVCLDQPAIMSKRTEDGASPPGIERGTEGSGRHPHGRGRGHGCQTGPEAPGMVPVPPRGWRLCDCGRGSSEAHKAADAGPRVSFLPLLQVGKVRPAPSFG